MASTSLLRCDVQLNALQGLWQNMDVPYELYIVQERTVTKFRANCYEVTGEMVQHLKVIVIDSSHDRVQWGKFILQWTPLSEGAGGLPDEILWIMPDAASTSHMPHTKPKQWRWQRIVASSNLAAALTELVPAVGPNAHIPASASGVSSPTVTLGTSPTIVSASAALVQQSLAAPSTPVAALPSKPMEPRPPATPPPPHLIAAKLPLEPPSNLATQLGQWKSGPVVVEPRPHLTQQLSSTEGKVTSALQGSWVNILDNTETYQVTGLSVARRKANRRAFHMRGQSQGGRKANRWAIMETRTFHMRWNATFHRIQWGMGKYYLQMPMAVPMQAAIWLSSDGRSRGFSWSRLARSPQDAAMPSSMSGSLAPAAPVPECLVHMPRPLARQPGPHGLQNAAMPSSMPGSLAPAAPGPDGLVHMPRPLARQPGPDGLVPVPRPLTTVPSRPDGLVPVPRSLGLVSITRPRAHQQTTSEAEQQQRLAVMPQQLQHQQLLHQRTQLEQQQHLFGVMMQQQQTSAQALMSMYRLTPY